MVDANSSSPSLKLPWLWSLEALAGIKEVDSPLLNDLISGVSEFYDESFKNVRERVALRCLEQWLNVSNVSDTSIVPVTSGSNFGIIDGVSEQRSCQDILYLILNKTTTSNLTMSTSEMLKPRVHQFILQKRANLPKCTLQQLKDAILEGGHPFSASLMKRSGLDKENQDVSKIPVDWGDPVEHARRHNDTSDGKIEETKGQLFHPVFEDGKEPLQEHPPGENIKSSRWGETIEKQVTHLDENYLYLDDVDHHAARSPKLCLKGSDCQSQDLNLGSAVSEIRNKIMRGDPSDSILISAKRGRSGYAEDGQVDSLDRSKIGTDSIDHRVDVNSLTQRTKCGQIHSIGWNSVPLHENKYVQEDPPGRILLLPDTSILSKETQVQGLDGTGICGEGGEGVPLKRIKHSNNDAKIQYDMSQDNKISLESHPDGSQQNNVEETEGDSNDPVETETSSDSDGIHNKTSFFDLHNKMVIAAEKGRFLNSQNTIDHDSQGRSDRTAKRLCSKCKKGGSVLNCSVNCCPLSIHESCLGISASFDDKGNFYCPFCLYAQAIAAYHDSKKKVALARNCLATFTCMLNGFHCKKQAGRSPSQGPQSRTTGYMGLPDNEQKKIVSNKSMQEVEHQKEAEDAVELLNGVLPCREAEKSIGCERNDVVLTREEQPKQIDYQSRITGYVDLPDKIHDDKEQKNIVSNQSMQVVEHQKEVEDAVVRLNGGLPCREAEKSISCERNAVVLTRGKQSKQVGGHWSWGVVEDQRPSEPSTACCNDDLPLREEETIAISETPCVSLIKEREKERIAEESQPIKGGENQKKNKEVGMECESANSPPRNRESVLVSQRSAEVGTGKSALQQQTIIPPPQTSFQLNINAKETTGNENDDDVSSHYSFRLRRPTNQYSIPTSPSSRRKKIPWTAEEEEILVEGVQRFSSTDWKNVPWKKILEFGRHVFQKSRTPVDLKDKWRNIWTKGGPRAR